MLHFLVLSSLGLFVAIEASKQQPLEPLTKFRMLRNAGKQRSHGDFVIVLQARLTEKQQRGNYVVVHMCMIRRPSR